MGGGGGQPLLTVSEVVVNTETKGLIAACIDQRDVMVSSGKVRRTEVNFCHSREMAESQNNVHNHRVCAHHPFPSIIQNNS